MSTLKKQRKKEKKSTLRRLVVANLVALLGLITATVAMLFALGLLDSIFAFFF